MYCRIYSNKSNTIFKRLQGSVDQVNGNVNTGKSPISELMTGFSYSTMLMQFDLSQIATLLANNPYTCKLKLFDAGTIFEPSIKLEPVDLFYFKEDFTEGDGFFYIEGKALSGFSNYNNRDSVNSWTGVFSTGLLPALTLNSANEDLTFNSLETFITDAITNSVNPNFGLRLSTNTPDSDTYTKFIHTRYTKTIFQPYLEFYIENDIIDDRFNFVATKSNSLFLLNATQEAFVGTVTVELRDEDDNIIVTPTVNNTSLGVYSIDYTPAIALSDKIISDIWYIDGNQVKKGIIKIQSPNKIGLTTINGNLYFYPTTTITNPLVRKGDKLKIDIISEVRGKGSVVLPHYEYKVVSTSNFEMQPWESVNVYNGKMFCYIDTSFYYEELQYEILVRLNLGNEIKTSPMSYKFRVIADTASHLRDRSASPYNDRDYTFKK